MKTIGETRTKTEIIDISRYTANFIIDNLGPKGTWNLISDKHGILNWTKNASATFKKVEPKPDKLKKPNEKEATHSPSMTHPINQMITDIASNITMTVGDGSKTAIILVGELIKKYATLNISPILFVDGCQSALTQCQKIIDNIKVEIPIQKKTLITVLKTFFKGSLESHEEILTNYVVKAILQVSQQVNNKYSFKSENVDVRKEAGATIFDTQIVSGVTFFREIPNPNMPKKIINGNIAIISGELLSKFKKRETKLMHYSDYQLIIEDTGQINKIRDEELRVFQETVQKLVNLNVKVVIFEKGIDPIAEELLTEKGILALRRFHPKDLARIAKTVNATVVPEVKFLSSEHLGFADLVEEKMINNRPWIFIQKKGSPVVTILVRGSTGEGKGIIDEIARIITNSLQVAETLILNPEIVAGGGALEAELASQIRMWAKTISGPKQLIAEVVAESFEVIPMQLAKSCSLDPINVVTELRKRHRQGERWAGIDVFKGEITDMFTAEVFEPASVKKEVLKSSSEMVSSLLRINDFIAAKRITGEEYWEKRQEEFTEPERVKKIHKDYGVDV